jgi:predicted RNA binding protein YcfA (HicA-like mRNA interferase family)
LKFPRDLSGRVLAQLLRREFGYEITRQKGSHIRLTTEVGGTHHITLPDHDPFRIGTLSAILTEVAQHSGLTRRVVEERLFYR